jgi:hypothetical protein
VRKCRPARPGRPDLPMIVRVGDFSRGRGASSSGPHASRNAVDGAPSLHVCSFSRVFVMRNARGFWVPWFRYPTQSYKVRSCRNIRGQHHAVLGFSIMVMDFPLLTEVAQSMQLVGAWYYYYSYHLVLKQFKCCKICRKVSPGTINLHKIYTLM